jgi:gamma-glutamylcyclotransferase (GGCT)/AIG2-like uncharacterized protein YtfP
MASCDLLPPFRLFTYGTLMLPEVMGAVCGATFPSETAVLVGYGQYRLKKEVFPAIIEKSGACTDGLLYHGIGKKAFERLDIFEGDLYSRREVQVMLTEGRAVCCFTYVLKDRHRRLLYDTPWSVQLFRDMHLVDFLSRLVVG